MLENVQAENKKLAETCAIMEQDIVKYQEKIKELKEQKKQSKILLVEKWKLMKELKFKEKEIFKVWKDINQVKTDAKGDQDSFNMKINQLNQANADLNA